MYPSNLTDRQWKKIKHFFRRPDARGARSKHSKRSIVNAILYVVKGGIQWRMMPKDMPPWQTVYDHFRRLSARGVWKQVLNALNVEIRISYGKKAFPSYAIVDSQSVKTQYRGKNRGYDGGKKNKRKKETHILRHHW